MILNQHGRLLLLFGLTTLVDLPTAYAEYPPATHSEKVAPGIRLDIFRLESSGSGTQTIWIYQPDPSPREPPPIVLVPPAGGNLFSAPPLTEEDRPEHLPYVMAGFVVVSFSLRGRWTGDLADCAELFRSSGAGVLDAGSALDCALSVLPSPRMDAIYIAGHSSAGTLALLVAASDPRIRGAAVFAPVYDVRAFLLDGMEQLLETEFPGYGDFLVQSSPVMHFTDLSVPIMVFHARDDSVVAYASSVTAVEELRSLGVPVTFHSSLSGGHYDSMITEGIPLAIRWLRSLQTD